MEDTVIVCFQSHGNSDTFVAARQTHMVKRWPGQIAEEMKRASLQKASRSKLLSICKTRARNVKQKFRMQ